MHVFSGWQNALKLSFIFLLSSGLAFANGKKTNVDGPRRMILTRYSGHKNFHSRSTQTWNYDGATFNPGDAGISHQMQFRDCESYLAEQQEFPLHKMVESDYITPEQMRELQDLGIKLKTDQVNFLQMERGEEVTATLWSIAAQILGVGKGIEPVLMPWQKDPKRSKVNLNRDKYKYVWEWGRAAQDVPKEIGPLYAANALLNYVELKAHGGRLEDAYVMFHSLDKANTRFYLRQHPDSLFTEGGTDADDCLFLVPLSEMLTKYPGRDASALVAKIVQLTNQKITDREAVDLLMANKLFHWDELELALFNKPAQKTPIIINDMSVGRLIFLEFYVRRHHLDAQERDGVLQVLLQEVQPLLHTYNSQGKYDNAVDSLMTSYDYQQNNAVEISNLDPRDAAADDNYVRQVIMAAYSYYIKRIAGALVEAGGVAPAESCDLAVAEFARHQISLGISTAAPGIVAQAQLLQPFYTASTPTTITESPLDPQDPVVRGNPYWFTESHIFMFNAGQVAQIIRANPFLFHHAVEGLKPGVWRSRYFLEQVDIF